MATENISKLKPHCGGVTLVLLVGVIATMLVLRLSDSTAQARQSTDERVYLPVVLVGSGPSQLPELVLISEVAYDPTTAEPDGEWIELFNAGSVPVDLGGYHLGDAAYQGETEGMVVFPSPYWLAPGQVIVVANRGQTFFNYYKFYPDFELIDSLSQVPNLPPDLAWSDGPLELTNSGDELVLTGPDYTLVDALSWGSSTFAFSPSIPAVQAGHSLERFPASQDSDQASDWRNQPSPDPANADLQVPTATATASPTATSTATRTFTPTRTPNPSRTATSTRTAKATGTSTLTPTGTASPSATASATASPTVTPVPVMVINEIHVDPDAIYGDANGDSMVEDKDQFIEIVNQTGAAVDMSGWTINYSLAIRHTFPLGSVVPNNCAVVVFGGGHPVGSFGGSRVQTASSGTLLFGLAGGTIVIDTTRGLTFSYTYGLEANQNQSITRVPDITGPNPLVPHMTAAGSGGKRFSPGTRVDGIPFGGCTAALEKGFFKAFHRTKAEKVS